MALKHLALLLSEKNGEKYADVMSLLRCRFSFAIARSALVCLRGSRSSRFQDVGDNSMELPARVVRNETTFVISQAFFYCFNCFTRVRLY